MIQRLKSQHLLIIYVYKLEIARSQKVSRTFPVMREIWRLSRNIKGTAATKQQNPQHTSAARKVIFPQRREKVPDGVKNILKCSLRVQDICHI